LQFLFSSSHTTQRFPFVFVIFSAGLDPTVGIGDRLNGGKGGQAGKHGKPGKGGEGGDGGK